jgi:inner membrane protein
VLALAVLPFLLAGAMLLADRLARRIGGSVFRPAASGRELLLLSTVSILTHPVLDTLNTYGVRWLMPFDGRWFYGDAVFIVDPWMWLALALGLFLSRRRTRPARVALAAVAAYASAMALSGLAARLMVATELGRGGPAPDALMLSPRLATPFERTVVAARGAEYLVGEFHWLRSPRFDAGAVRRYARPRPDHPAVDAAAATAVGRRFLSWARFPTYRIEANGAGGFTVHIIDLRYADRPGVSFGAVSIPVGAPETGPAR